MELAGSEPVGPEKRENRQPTPLAKGRFEANNQTPELI